MYALAQKNRKEKELNGLFAMNARRALFQAKLEIALTAPTDALRRGGFRLAVCAPVKAITRPSVWRPVILPGRKRFYKSKKMDEIQRKSGVVLP